MRVLVVGSGGREHALCWALSASPLLDKLWCAPGNPGTPGSPRYVPIGADGYSPASSPSRATTAWTWWCPVRKRRWSPGLADAMEAAGIACCGPSAAAAQLEGSKAFTKEIARPPASRPRAGSGSTTPDAAREFVRRRGAPIVVKADGLAAGKGVVVAATVAEAEAAIDAIMERRASARPAPRW